MEESKSFTSIIYSGGELIEENVVGENSGDESIDDDSTKERVTEEEKENHLSLSEEEEEEEEISSYEEADELKDYPSLSETLVPFTNELKRRLDSKDAYLWFGLFAFVFYHLVVFYLFLILVLLLIIGKKL
jgi:hypothetical protein